jgi:hypothetical protein
MLTFGYFIAEFIEYLLNDQDASMLLREVSH